MGYVFIFAISTNHTPWHKFMRTRLWKALAQLCAPAMIKVLAVGGCGGSGWRCT